MLQKISLILIFINVRILFLITVSNFLFVIITFTIFCTLFLFAIISFYLRKVKIVAAFSVICSSSSSSLSSSFSSSLSFSSSPTSFTFFISALTSSLIPQFPLHHFLPHYHLSYCLSPHHFLLFSFSPAQLSFCSSSFSQHL